MDWNLTWQETTITSIDFGSGALRLSLFPFLLMATKYRLLQCSMPYMFLPAPCNMYSLNLYLAEASLPFRRMSTTLNSGLFGRKGDRQTDRQTCDSFFPANKLRLPRLWVAVADEKWRMQFVWRSCLLLCGTCFSRQRKLRIGTSRIVPYSADWICLHEVAWLCA